MLQSSGHRCPTCGNMVPFGQRFCANCGAVQNGETNRQTERADEHSGGADKTPLSIPPPPPESYRASPQAQSYPQYSGTPTPLQQTPPPYAVAQQNSSKGVFRQVGCVTGIILLVILAFCGTVSYFIYNGIQSAASKAAKNIATSTSNNSSSAGSNVTPTLPPITTFPINETVTYASITMTVLDAKQGLAFVDDSNSSPAGVVRLDFKEVAGTGTPGNFAYGDVFRLLLPDGTSVVPLSEQNPSSPSASTSRSNWVDFPVSTSTKVGDLVLRIGQTTETQMDVPLTGKADLSKYQDKTSTPNKQTQYDGLTWTLTKATISLSSGGKQADSGMLYVTVTLRVDNPTTNGFNAYWGDYARLKAGNTTSVPTINSTLPLSFAAGSSGGSGDVIFQLPQGNTTYTLILLGNASSQISQATIDFQVG